MEAAHRWGFDPNQPGVKALLKARSYADEGEVEVEITERPVVVRPLGRWCGPGERVLVPKPYAEGLVERGFARRFAGPS
jgi:hypothetical protein